MKIATLITTITTVVCIALSSAAKAADIDVNADENDVAIHGYDPVSYFTDGAAVMGSPKYTATHNSAIYQFSSDNNRRSFRDSPAKFAPQFGGFCAMGVVFNKKLDTDPTAWKIVDGKLYLNLNKTVQKKWLSDIPGHIESANRVWHGIEDVTIAVLNAE